MVSGQKIFFTDLINSRLKFSDLYSGFNSFFHGSIFRGSWMGCAVSH